MGLIVYKDVMSMVKMILFSPEKVTLRKISSARSFQFYEGSRAISSLERLESLVLQLKFS